MRLLITGGGGFLGAWTAKLAIERGIDVRILDLADDRTVVSRILGCAIGQLDWYTGDVTQGRDLARAVDGCDGLLHLAGLLTPACQVDPVRGAQVNLIGTLNAFEAAHRHGIGHVVYTSSVSVFGPDDGLVPFPTTHYGAFKLATEGSGRAFLETQGTSSVGYRVGVVYGLGRESGLTAGLTHACRAAASGEAYVVPFSGRVPIVHVRDVARAFIEAIVLPAQGAHVHNCVADVLEVADFVAAVKRAKPAARLAIAGPRVPFSVDPAGHPIQAGFPDFRYAALDDSIGETIESYSEAFDVGA